MPLTLPQLDDRTYADLLDEAQALIPSLYPGWTDHNPSDPGITLIELFAWLTEMLIFRTDQVPNRHRLVFLRLINGPERQQALLATTAGIDAITRERLLDLLYTPGAGDTAPTEQVDEAVRLTVLGLRSRTRAITNADYEALACAASPLVNRAKCLPRRNLEANSEAEHSEICAGHVSVIILPQDTGAAALPDNALLKTVWQYLDERRTLTTRHHVVAPFYAPVSAAILVARRADAHDEALRGAVVAACERFLHPISGGADQTGWPFGRSIYLSELYELLESIPGVDYVPDIMLSSAFTPAIQRCVLAVPTWHENGDQIGLSLQAHHLPCARIDPTQVIVAPSFAQLRLNVAVVLQGNTEHASVYRAIKTALKQRLHPLYKEPDGRLDGEKEWAITTRDGIQKSDLDEPWSTGLVITVEALRGIVRVIPGVQSVAGLSIEGDARWQIRNRIGEIVAFGSQAHASPTHELVDPQVIITRAY